MTTTSIWLVGSNPDPLTHPSEVDFEQFMLDQGYVFVKEPYRFDISRGDHPDREVQPDFYITQTPDGVEQTHLFIEITQPDRFPSVLTLPKRVRKWNRLHSQSKQAYITVEEYMIRKRSRMQRAESRHGIIIIVLDYAAQQAIFANPSILEAKIIKRLAPSRTL